MDLQIKNKTFLITGATSGLGNGIARALLDEGAKLIAVARTKESLSAFKNEFPNQIETIQLDVTKDEKLDQLLLYTKDKIIDGIVVNAGGPPPKSVLETDMEDWDAGYHTIVRWKIKLVKAFTERFLLNKYGRIVFIESSTVKQPLENLVLSNSLRLAIVGFAKTLSQEVADKGITLNVLAPGFHETAAVERLYKKKSENENISIEEAKNDFISHIKVGKIGDPFKFGLLGAWLLSPHSSYITGQTISVDGGFIQGVMG